MKKVSKLFEKSGPILDIFCLSLEQKQKRFFGNFSRQGGIKFSSAELSKKFLTKNCPKIRLVSDNAKVRLIPS